MPQIRRILKDEANMVLLLWNENCLEAAGQSLLNNELSNVEKRLIRYASHSNAFCFVAEEKNEFIGFVTACLISHPVMEEGLSGEIEELYVLPKMRRSGVGSELVKCAVNSMRTRGASIIRTQVSMESQLAQKFWQNLGWENDMTIFSFY